MLQHAFWLPCGHSDLQSDGHRKKHSRFFVHTRISASRHAPGTLGPLMQEGVRSPIFASLEGQSQHTVSVLLDLPWKSSLLYRLACAAHLPSTLSGDPRAAKTGGFLNRASLQDLRNSDAFSAGTEATKVVAHFSAWGTRREWTPWAFQSLDSRTVGTSEGEL